ncbi:unnamed protein product, partial [Iphiclides podalirius]
MKLLIIFLFAQQCSSFDIPRESCRSDLNIEDNHYNVSNIYHTDDAYPTDAHYDERGNIFFVEAGSNSEGYYFNARIIEANSTTPKKIPGLPEGTSYSIAIDRNNEKVYFGTSRAAEQTVVQPFVELTAVLLLPIVELTAVLNAGQIVVQLQDAGRTAVQPNVVQIAGLLNVELTVVLQGAEQTVELLNVAPIVVLLHIEMLDAAGLIVSEVQIAGQVVVQPFGMRYSLTVGWEVLMLIALGSLQQLFGHHPSRYRSH